MEQERRRMTVTLSVISFQVMDFFHKSRLKWVLFGEYSRGSCPLSGSKTHYQTFLNRPLFSIALFFFLFITLLVLKSNILFAPHHWDAMGYVAKSADSFLQNGQLSSFTHLSVHPPLFFIALVSIWKIFGHSLLTSHVFILFFGALSLVFLFNLTKKIFGFKEAVAASILLLANPLFFAQVGIIHLAIPLTCFAILTVYLYINQKYWLFVLSATAMLLVKETTTVVLLAIIIYDFFQRVLAREKFIIAVKKALFLALPAIPLALWYLYHWQMEGMLVHRHFIWNKARFLGLSLDNFMRYLIFDRSVENATKVNWIIFLVLSVFFIYQIAKKKNLNNEILFLMIIILNILFFSYSDDLPRYFLVIFPFYFILGARAFVFLSEKWRMKNFLWAFLLTAVVILSVMNYTGQRNTEGWRLESNMEYLDFVKVSQLACQYLESRYPDHKIITTFPLTSALQYPYCGYVQKPLSVVPLDELDDHKDILVVRAFNANPRHFRRFFQANKTKLKRIKKFSVRGKDVIIYRRII